MMEIGSMPGAFAPPSPGLVRSLKIRLPVRESAAGF
jgi:hypothetical protein